MDTSALVKLVVAEEESESLKSFVREHADDGLFSAALARTELLRAVAPNGAPAIADARKLLNGQDTAPPPPPPPPPHPFCTPRGNLIIIPPICDEIGVPD